MYHRGDIYYIEKSSYAQPTGSEQFSGRPAIIVSNDENNEFSPTLEIVYLTTKPKPNLPTHVDITSSPKPSIALCEQINTVAKERVGDYLATCSDYEIAMIEAALEISLGIGADDDGGKTVEETVDEPKESQYASTPPSSQRRLMIKLYESQQSAICIKSFTRKCS